MDWKKVYFGKLSRKEIQEAVKDMDWQAVRIGMKGTSIRVKYDTLKWWLEKQKYTNKAKIQVTNYVTALSRGGLIKPEDYL